LTSQVDNLEALREALLNLERLREKEKNARLQMETLVGGLTVLNECQSVTEMYQEILACLQKLIDFDAASILVKGDDGYFSTAVCSDDRLRFQQIPSTGVFERCANGRATILTDLSKVTAWPTPTCVNSQASNSDLQKQKDLSSVLMVSLPSLQSKTLLVIASEIKSKLKTSDLSLLQSFTPLATQAVQRAKEMEKLNYLVTSLDYQAHFDLLTGLPNRTLLEQRIDSIVANDDVATVMFLDLDNFKSINDTFGHAVGDIILSETAFRISSVLEHNDIVARMGGDEFALVICSKQSVESIEDFCSTLLDIIRKPIFFRNSRIVCSASVGVFNPVDSQTASQISMQKADIAMFEAKKLGRNRFCFFNDDMRRRVQAEFDVESQLHKAVEQHDFHLVYQPIVKAGHLTCNRLEVLVRWGAEDDSLYGPQLFIPIAEKTGHIIELGHWITKQALLECNSWLKASPSRTLCINVSQLQLQRSDFSTELLALLSQTGIDPRQLELELSENIIADCIDTLVSNNIDNLSEQGINFAFDDFGTGSSSLLHLQKFPGSCLKIDKSFIDNIVCCEEHQKLVSGIIKFSHHLNMEVVAEGVESDKQLELLASLGADYIQGYVISKPVRKNGIFSLLNEWELKNQQFSSTETGT
jgi:diguanylate cyclase (GGDEF)-like protein